MDPVTALAEVSPLLIVAELVVAVIAAGVLHVAVRRPPPPALTVRPLPEGGVVEPPDFTADDTTTDAGVVVAPRKKVVADSRPPPAAAEPGSLFGMLRSALGRSREVLREGLDRLLGRPLDAAATEDLEELLIRADVGLPTTERLLERVRALGRDTDGEALRSALKNEMSAILRPVHRPFAVPAGLWVVLVVGVNGSGKTTTIGKLAARLKGEGRRVLVAAGDTFRAAAEQQLTVWAERAGVDVLSLDEGADPAAVAFKAIERAKAEGHDVVLVDTAGRLQTRKPLMEELGKVRRVLDKALPGAPHETLLVLDGTMGQNGMSQATLFHQATPLTGVVVTKLDGTARGGMILAIANELKLPVKLVGLGEKVSDLRDFDPDAFVDALL